MNNQQTHESNHNRPEYSKWALGVLSLIRHVTKLLCFVGVATCYHAVMKHCEPINNTQPQPYHYIPEYNKCGVVLFRLVRLVTASLRLIGVDACYYTVGNRWVIRKQLKIGRETYIISLLAKYPKYISHSFKLNANQYHHPATV